MRVLQPDMYEEVMAKVREWRWENRHKRNRLTSMAGNHRRHFGHADLARDITAEIRRGFDQVERYHQERMIM